MSCRWLSVAAVILLCATQGIGPRAASAQDTNALRATDPPPNAIWVEDLDLDQMFQRRGRPRAGQSFRRTPITLNGVVYPHGIGTQSISEFLIDLKGQAVRFMAMVGIDDVAADRQGTVNFEVWADDRKAAESGILRAGDPPKLLSVDLTDVQILTLLLDDGQDVSTGDIADWAGAMIVMKPDATMRPEPYKMPSDPPLTISSGDPAAPVVHPPRIVGATPGRPFLFLVPATGEAPLTYSATNLPAGLTLDAKTGIISGSLETAGETVVEVTVRGPKGETASNLTIVGGERKLALTPPLGWNSWNAWGTSIDDAKVRAAADWMVKTGLAAHGYQYINIDDGWEDTRDENGVLQPNEKFPDMKALADYVHSKGLKLGIYSGPGPRTCGGFEGSYQHEDIDAATWAEWGIDYLKHDWCSYSRIAKDDSLPELQKPYIIMRDALDKTNRDFVYSLCQYGMGDVWEWGADPAVGGNLWRTTGDLLDSWANLESVGFRQAGREKHAGPGHWNDTDMLVVGTVGWGPNQHPTRLTKNEQILHISLWTLQAAPMLTGADLAKLDQFTIDLLTNTEMLEIHQDPLGVAGGPVWEVDRLEVWARPLSDGTKAVGLFNRGLKPYKVTARWSDLGLSGPQPVRDVWQRKDLGVFDGEFSVEVPRHGAVLIKVGTPR